MDLVHLIHDVDVPHPVPCHPDVFDTGDLNSSVCLLLAAGLRQGSEAIPEDSASLVVSPDTPDESRIWVSAPAVKQHSLLGKRVYIASLMRPIAVSRTGGQLAVAGS